MKSSRALEIAANIESVTGMSVFDVGRTLPIVDVRSLFCYILRVDFNYKLVEVRDIIRASGRPYDHATVYYNVNLYIKDVKNRRPELEELRLQLLNQYSPYFVMLKKTQAITDESLMQQIIKLIDDYEL